MGDINTKVHNINTKQDFLAFLELLIQDLRTKPGEWENNNLESYLGAVSSWTADMEGYFINNNLPVPEKVDWRTFGMILMAAKVYE